MNTILLRGLVTVLFSDYLAGCRVVISGTSRSMQKFRAGLHIEEIEARSLTCIYTTGCAEIQ